MLPSSLTRRRSQLSAVKVLLLMLKMMLMVGGVVGFGEGRRERGRRKEHREGKFVAGS